MGFVGGGRVLFGCRLDGDVSMDGKMYLWCLAN